MSRLLLKQLDNYIKLNPDVVSAVFDKFGIPADVKVTPYSVLDAYRYFKEPFAVELFNALYPQISTSMTKPEFSNLVTDATQGTESPEVANKTSFWEGFAGVLNALVSAAPIVADSISTVKHGTQPVNTYPQPTANNYQSPNSGVDKNVLIYIGIGFLAVIVAILLFKKLK